MPSLCCFDKRKSAKEELGRSYWFPHTACCPCFDAFDLFCDDSYDWEKWQAHKSWARHVPHPFTCLMVAAWYWPPVLMAAGISCMLGVYVEKGEPQGAPNLSDRDFTAPFMLTSFALALLLVFRTNNTYDRWWEARKILGGMLGLARDLVRQAMTVAKPETAHLVAMLARFTIAMPYLLHHHVTEFKGLPPQLQRVMSCRQPIPRAYTRHTGRFIITYTVFLPFALWNTCQWLTPFVSAIVTFLLIGIENIGIQNEQPFAVLPLDHFSRIIERDVQEQLQMREESEALLEASRVAPQPTAQQNGSAGSPQLHQGGHAASLWPSGCNAFPQQAAPKPQEMGAFNGSSPPLTDGVTVDMAAVQRASADGSAGKHP